MKQLDDRDVELMKERIKNRDKRKGPRIGDYILFPTGELERFSHDWGDDIQTSSGGSIYLGKEGYGSFSGGLNPSTPKDQMTETSATLPGPFWFFHHDYASAHNGVEIEIPCRVYLTDAPHTGYHPDGYSPPQHPLKQVLAEQLGDLDAILAERLAKSQTNAALPTP